MICTTMVNFSMHAPLNLSYSAMFVSLSNHLRELNFKSHTRLWISHEFQPLTMQFRYLFFEHDWFISIQVCTSDTCT